MAAPEYPIGTLHEIAAIPEEALPRFLAELPAILREVRRLKAIQVMLTEVSDGAMEMTTLGPSWVDDALGNTTITVESDLWDENIVLRRPLDPVRA